MIGFSDDDALAAEYVIGTLDGAERLAAEGRRQRDPAFEAAVQGWELRLAPLAVATLAVEPPSDLLARILPKLDTAQAVSRPSNVIDLRRKVRVWRGVAAVASALAAALAIWIAQTNTNGLSQTPQTYVAVLQQGAGTPSFVVSVDLKSRTMAVMPIGTKAPADKSYQLWMIGAGSGKPQSLGLVDEGAAHPALPTEDRGMISNATYAVTLEPHGGSPTGQPTSAPIFTGKLLDVGK